MAQMKPRTVRYGTSFFFNWTCRCMTEETTWFRHFFNSVVYTVSDHTGGWQGCRGIVGVLCPGLRNRTGSYLLRFLFQFWFRLLTSYSSGSSSVSRPKKAVKILVFVLNLGFLMLIEAALSSLLSFLLWFHFFTVTVPLRQKVTVPAVPVPQHWLFVVYLCSDSS